MFLVTMALLPVAGRAETAVTGHATYRERIALSPDAVFEATLEDVSLADAPAKIVGQARVAPAGQVPIAFSIPYDAAAIQPNHRYSVRGRIMEGGGLRFTTTQIYPVLTQGAGDTVELMMQMVTATGDGSSALGTSPATFTGELPCADCPGIRWQLELLPDGAYFAHYTYLERDAALDEVGRWALDPQGGILSLRSGPSGDMRFRMIGPDTFRQVDAEGADIPGGAERDLKRADGLPALEPKLKLRGMYSYMADAGRFRECVTQLDLPVATQADNAALERAYGEVRREPAQPLLAEVEGRIAMLPPMEGPKPVLTLVVEKFIGVWPRETCGAVFATADLRNTYWRLTRLADKPVTAAFDQREPHIILRLDGKLSGSGGCNQLAGTYESDGDTLRFGPLAMTRMACPDGMDVEQAFAAALDATRTFRIEGEHLELQGEDGAPLARLEATYLK
ncbi:MAG: YbaY family lipoprotein [Geminicoccaceae bacterium]